MLKDVFKKVYEKRKKRLKIALIIGVVLLIGSTVTSGIVAFLKMKNRVEVYCSNNSKLLFTDNFSKLYLDAGVVNCNRNSKDANIIECPIFTNNKYSIVSNLVYDRNGHKVFLLVRIPKEVIEENGLKSTAELCYLMNLGYSSFLDGCVDMSSIRTNCSENQSP